MQTGLEKNLFGNHLVSSPLTESRGPPPAFASDPLVALSSTASRENNLSSSSVAKDGINISDIVEIESPNSAGDFMKTSSPVGVGKFPLFEMFSACMRGM